MAKFVDKLVKNLTNLANNSKDEVSPKIDKFGKEIKNK